MSLSAGSSSKKTSTNSTTVSDPWAPTVPYLKNYLTGLDGYSDNLGLTDGQKSAYATLEKSAAEGNPWTTQISGLATNQLGYSSAGDRKTVDDAYSGLKDNLSKYANGDYLDVSKNPELQGLLATVRDDISNQVNQQFAAAGRDLSGANQGALARGVSQGTASILIDQYNQQQQNQINAAQALNNAGVTAATTGANLDQGANAINTAGLTTSNAALAAKDYGANQLLNLETQQQQLPLENYGTYGGLVSTIAGLGGTSNTNGTSTTKGTSFGGTLNLLSDERAKEDIEEVGSMADGTKIYRYRYKGDPQVHVGPIAQEVEQSTPSAVANDGPGGLKTVNMDAATRKAADIVRRRRSAKGGQE